MTLGDFCLFVCLLSGIDHSLRTAREVSQQQPYVIASTPSTGKSRMSAKHH